MSGTLKFSGDLDGAAKADAFLQSCGNRMDRAAISGTNRSTEALAINASSAIQSITGKGVYWTINKNVTEHASGAIGRVVTPPSKRHPILGRVGKPLRFRAGGRWVTTYRVDHPGSNPVNWPGKLGAFAEASKRIFEQEVQREAEGLNA